MIIAVRISHFVLLSFGMRFVSVVMRLSKSRNTDARKKNAPDLQEVGGKSDARVGCLAMPAEGIPYCLLV